MPYTTPFTFNSHPPIILLLILLFVAYPITLTVTVRRRASRGASTRTYRGSLFKLGLNNASKQQIVCFYGGVLLGALSLYWPLGDIARSYSLFVYLVSNSILALIATPLVLIGLPKWFLVEITRAKPIDWVLRHCARAVTATVLFSFTMITSMLPTVVEWESISTITWDLVHILIVLSASIMWMTGLNLLPGVRRISAAGRVGFFFAQSLLPSFPAVVLLFAKRSLYRPYLFEAHHLGINPVTDQQLAGGLVKLISILVFWSVAGIILAKASKSNDLGIESEPITWDDVEREFQRSTPHR